jgi:hypothetical protein
VTNLPRCRVWENFLQGHLCDGHADCPYADTCYSDVFLPGAGDGISFHWKFDGSKLRELDVWAALSQILFSLSLGLPIHCCSID